MANQEIIQALRCASSPRQERNCDGCPYLREEDVPEDMQSKLGCDKWYSCDVDRMGLDAADRLERLDAYERTGLTPEEVIELETDWNVRCTIIGECGGFDRIRELAEADKAGRVRII